MNSHDIDEPLGSQFYQNPYEFLQGFVRNMNNEIFLSEYQLNHLYALMLLKRESPWDLVKPNNENMKIQIQEIVNKKLLEVKKILQGLSQVYENKVKKNTFSQIQRLMNIIKAKNKSIFIEKDMEFFHQLHMRRQSQQKIVTQQLKQKVNDQINTNLIDIQNEKTQNQQTEKHESQNTQNDIKQTINEEQNTQKQNNSGIEQALMRQNTGDDRQVMSLFYGLANLPNLSTLALGNCLEYSSAERYIKFKMSKNYIMTIKNEDEQAFDRQSTLKNVSNDLYTHHIFPFLTAVDLFKARAVCRQWMQNVKEAWHSTFKREMFVQLMACEFCKQIEFYYKMIQLRNPFFQKITLLMHALLQIIQWDKVIESIENNSVLPLLKKVLIILLKLVGEEIVITNMNSITDDIWNQNKQKILLIKQRVSTFLNILNSSVLSISQLIKIKVNLLDDPFMRVEEVNSDDKTPLLLVIFIKQMTLQQILKNHIYFSQQYLMNTKRRLDNVSSKMPQQKGFLEGVYKILLLKNIGSSFRQDKDQSRSEMPNFQDLLSSIFSSSEENKPDFVIKNNSSSTSIYLDKATKLDIIVSTVRKIKDESDDFDQCKHEQLKDSKDVNIQTEQYKVIQPKKQLKTMNIYNINLGQNKKVPEKHDFEQNIYEYEIKQEQKKNQDEKKEQFE